MNWLKKVYRSLVDHLTKTLGAVGVVLLGADMSGYLEGVKAAAMQYLPQALADQVSKKVGLVLFGLVILRGWWTAKKFQQVKAGS